MVDSVIPMSIVLNYGDPSLILKQNLIIVSIGRYLIETIQPEAMLV